MRFFGALGLLLLLGTGGCRSASRKASEPKFEDYPVTEMFNGRPAAPNLVTPEEQAASTIIREGVERGKGVFASDRKNERVGPNFAGHDIIIEGVDGPDYLPVIIVDAVTGRVFQPPFAGKGGEHASYFSIPMDPFNFRGIDFRLNSRLLALPRACPDRAAGCRAYYFLWQDDHWVPLN